MTASASAPETAAAMLPDVAQVTASLALFGGVLADEIGDAFLTLVACLAAPKAPVETRQAWSRLFALLADKVELGTGPVVGDAWQDHLLERLLADDNPFSRKARLAPLAAMGGALVGQAHVELRLLQRLFRLDAHRLQAAARLQVPDGSWLAWDGLRPLEAAVELPHAAGHALKLEFAGAAEWGQLVAVLAEHYAHASTGALSRGRAFRWVRSAADGALEPISHPDPIRLDELVGYERERELLVRNTEQFLAGYPANNALLYGDRGTGKSSTVKALLNTYGPRGLRLIEVAKAHLPDLPRLLGQLRGRPERFVLFVDDLSFHESEVEYKELKAVLEGSLEARPANVLLYATSNRRHLVQESFGDRAGAVDGELHGVDTVQEKLSLSDRFGITLTFLAPDQERYLAIVRALARQRALVIDPEELRGRAITWSLRHRARSGRTARQFVDHLTGELGLAARAK